MDKKNSSIKEQSEEDNKKPLGFYGVPLYRLAPNMMTLLGLVVGVSAIRFALDNRWELAIYCILGSALIDGIDGRIARMLNASSEFGAELDSLCDFVNFGLAPALIIYLWSFQQYEYRLFSWAAMMIYVSCMAIRLARFNAASIVETINLDQNPNEKKKPRNFFVGVPAPSGALLCLIPIILDFEVAQFFDIEVRNQTFLIDLYIIIIALLMASRIPTLSIKNLRVPAKYLSISMVGFVILIVMALLYTWFFLPILAIIYIFSILMSAIFVKTRDLSH